jgi:hypothetical protein
MKKTVVITGGNNLGFLVVEHGDHGRITDVGGCNTSGVTVAATVYIWWHLHYLYSVCYSINLIQ